MKKVILLIAALFMLASAWAADPTKILVKYDVYGGYGEGVITALKAKWSAATISSFNGSTWPAFDSALTTQGPWPMVIVEAHNYPGAAAQYQNLANYYNSKVGPLFYADWSMNRGLNGPLLTAMGVTSAAGIPMPPIAHYTWNASHPICTGVTSWTYGNPGYGTGGQRITWATAVPVTGWTATQTPGQGGICVAPDGKSVISGLFISLNTSPTEMAKIWSNVLTFMWGGSGVAPASLGKVKALYR